MQRLGNEIWAKFGRMENGICLGDQLSKSRKMRCHLLIKRPRPPLGYLKDGLLLSLESEEKKKTFIIVLM